MQLSQLADETGTTTASIKYYLREGMLAPGRPLTATRAEYDDRHVARIRLIRALTDVVGVSVKQAAAILALIDHPDPDLFTTLGRAVSELPPHPEPRDDYPRARAIIDSLGWVYDERYAAVAQLERAVEAAEAAGVPLTDERLAAYGPAIESIAGYDIGATPAGTADAVEYAILGTALHEPVLVALRRLAHQTLASMALSRPTSEGAPPRAPRAAPR